MMLRVNSATPPVSDCAAGRSWTIGSSLGPESQDFAEVIGLRHRWIEHTFLERDPYQDLPSV